MRILTIGGTGMLGSSIMLHDTSNDLWGTYLGKKPKSKKILELDIIDGSRVNSIIKEVNPEVIIHTAALTNVDLCETDPNLANKVHVEGTQNLIQIAREIGAYFIYISTDSVFDGLTGNYKEDDEPNPLNNYARTKYEGELKVLKYSNSVIIRTNIYGYNWLPKKSIAEWIVDTLKEGNQVNLFKDVFFSPILVNNLSEILFKIINLKLTGIYHVASSNGISKLNFGQLIASIFELDSTLINAISISNLNLKAPRPLNPTLNCSKVQIYVKTEILSVRDGIESFKKLQISGYLDKLKNL